MATSFRIDLNQVLKAGDFSSKQRRALKRSIKDSTFKREFAERVVDEINSRTDRGIDKNGNSFRPYSKAYKNSKVFAIYGKSSRVNLKLTGEMRASIRTSKISSTSVTIDLASEEQKVKANRHIMGDGVPVRDFMGLPMNELTKILKETSKDLESVKNFDQFIDAVSAIGISGQISSDGEESGIAQNLLVAASIFGES